MSIMELVIDSEISTGMLMAKDETELPSSGCSANCMAHVINKTARYPQAELERLKEYMRKLNPPKQKHRIQNLE